MLLLLDSILATFLLIFIRLTSFFLIAPIFSMRGVPNIFKLGFAFFVSLLVINVIGIHTQLTFDGNYFVLILKEVIVGLLLGFIAAMFLYALQIAGGLIDLMMGFAIANVIDPQTGAQSPIMGNFKFMIAILVMLVTDGHHLLLRGILNSYYIVPLHHFLPIGEGGMAQFLIEAFVKSFAISLQIAAPIAASIFLVDVALGLISRTVPQMNMFVIGIPVKILTTFFILFLVLPGFGYVLNLLFSELFRSMDQLTQLMVR